MSGRQGAESGCGRGGGDAAPMAGINVGEVAAEAPRGSVQTAGLARKVDDRNAFTVGRQVSPNGAEHTLLGEPILARHVQRERARERARDVQACDSRAERGCDLRLALGFRLVNSSDDFAGRSSPRAEGRAESQRPPASATESGPAARSKRRLVGGLTYMVSPVRMARRLATLCHHSPLSAVTHT
jgi:hypothetical protein